MRRGHGPDSRPPPWLRMSGTALTAKSVLICEYDHTPAREQPEVSGPNAKHPAAIKAQSVTTGISLR